MDDTRPAHRLLEHASYTTTARECDVVMKGGITSGVLYPLAVCELATAYRLRNIGGTSAGAIAAAAAAAAEYGRHARKPGSGFEGYAALPTWLSQEGHLEGLFQPNRGTRSLHRLLMTAISPETRLKPVAVPMALVRTALSGRHAWIPLLAALPGVLIVAAILAGGTGSVLTWVGAALGSAVALAGLLAGSAVAVVAVGGRALSENMYGIVTGSAAASGEDSLTDWLTIRLDELAGIDPTERHPLTFGDLWQGPPGSESDDPAGRPAIDLEMLTTCVTQGTPYRLPGELGSTFAFDEAEFRRLFPRRVVDHLLSVAGGSRLSGGLVPLPPPDQLPVVVATRMSLSFPLLISAVPLYAVDWSMHDDDSEPVFERCWFSDGGITSNFPVSFFDTLLPSRPTFGINLRPFHPRHPRSEREEENVWMPETNTGGTLAWWTRWSTEPGVDSVAGFLRAILDTMQNWVDNQQTRVPGYRDRIIHISHGEDEGGMNLAMPPAVLRRLAERGRCSGRRLVEFYTTPPDAPGSGKRVVSWENHRWIRLRTSLSLMSSTLSTMARGYTDGYATDLGADLSGAPSYAFSNLDQQALGRALMKGTSDDGNPHRVELPAGLVELAEAIAEIERRGDRVPLAVGAPSPAPVFRIAPGERTARSGPAPT